jgi:hypothetical protein
MNATTKTQPANLHARDLVIDQVDGSIREIKLVWGEKIFMSDGGLLGAGEVDHVLIPGTAINRSPKESALWAETLLQCEIQDREFLDFDSAIDGVQ